MTSDPARHLADVGSRLLNTLRTFLEVPVPSLLPVAYTDALRDPVEILSGVCDGLLANETTPPPPEMEDLAPVWTEGLTHPGPRESEAAAPRFHRDVFRAEISDEFSLTSHSEARAPAPWRDVGIANASSPAGPESYVRSAEAADVLSSPPVSQREDPAPPDAVTPATPRPARSGLDPRPALGTRPPARSGVRAPGERLSVEPPSEDGYLPARLDGPLPESGGAPLPPARRASRGDYQPEAISTVAPADADYAPRDSKRVVAGLPRPGAVRLASDAGRLSAVLRAHAVGPDAAPGEDQTHPPASAGDGGELRRDPAVGRAGVEEILEGLADELETEFVRAYGSSGV